MKVTSTIVILSVSISAMAVDNVIDAHQTVTVGLDKIDFPNCWRKDDARAGTDQGISFKFASTESCPKNERGNWQILYKAPFTSIHGMRPDREYRNPVVGFSSEKKKVLGSVRVTFYGRRNSDHTEQWISRFECRDLMMGAEYTGSDTHDDGNALKENEIPPVFEKFVSGFKCSKKK